jgi:DNA-binding LacI/PurR family transcriptional regulator
MSTLARRPRYQQIADEMRLQMRRGELTVGARLPSFPEMRRQGVSQNTMEKVYDLLEADGLIERNAGSGVYIAQAGRRKNATGLIGFIGPGGKPADRFGMYLYGAHLQEGAQAEAGKHGLHLMLLDALAPKSAWKKIDGVLSTGVELPYATKTPQVFLMQQSGTAPAVMADDAGGVRAEINHLVELGHRRIAYLIAPHEPFHARRLAAYQDALLQNGVTPNPRWVRHLRELWTYPTRFVGAASARMAEWLHEDWDELSCTALLCQNDQTAIGAMEALQEAGLHVPDDVSIVGFDGTEAAEYCRPCLTTVKMPLFEIGARGVELLIQQINGEQDTQSVALPTKLKIGDSTALPRQK